MCEALHPPSSLLIALLCRAVLCCATLCRAALCVVQVDPFKVQLSVTWTYNFGADEVRWPVCAGLCMWLAG